MANKPVKADAKRRGVKKSDLKKIEERKRAKARLQKSHSDSYDDGYDRKYSDSYDDGYDREYSDSYDDGYDR